MSSQTDILKILDGQTTNGSSDAYVVGEINREGGKIYLSEVFFTAQGTWDGATATLEYSVDGGTIWIACGVDTTVTANGGGWAILPNKAKIRATVSGAGASTDLDVYV